MIDYKELAGIIAKIGFDDKELYKGFKNLSQKGMSQEGFLEFIVRLTELNPADCYIASKRFTPYSGYMHIASANILVNNEQGLEVALALNDRKLAREIYETNKESDPALSFKTAMAFQKYKKAADVVKKAYEQNMRSVMETIEQAGNFRCRSNSRHSFMIQQIMSKVEGFGPVFGLAFPITNECFLETIATFNRVQRTYFLSGTRSSEHYQKVDSSSFLKSLGAQSDLVAQKIFSIHICESRTLIERFTVSPKVIDYEARHMSTLRFKKYNPRKMQPDQIDEYVKKEVDQEYQDAVRAFYL